MGKVALALVVLAFGLGCMEGAAAVSVAALPVTGTATAAAPGAGGPAEPAEEWRGDWSGDYVVCGTDAGLFVRSAPSAEARSLRILAPGGRVHVREWSRGWAMVQPAEWVSGDYLCRSK